jgi:hypothetical protein
MPKASPWGLASENEFVQTLGLLVAIVLSRPFHQYLEYLSSLTSPVIFHLL